MTLEEIAVLYPGGRRTRPDHYETRCPLPAHRHGDQHPGLGFTRAADGRILVKCQLGCSTADILAAAGLTFAAVAPPSLNGGPYEEPAAVYVYRNARGSPVCEKVRMPGKRFFLRLPGAEKGGLQGVEAPLYGLPELLATAPGATIGIAEGEKDCDNLRRRGLPSTCNPHGAAGPGQSPKWKEEYTRWLKENVGDRRFIVFADQDEAGLAHAQAIVDSLQRSGLPVRVAPLSGLNTGEDISDWLGRHSDTEFAALLEPPSHPLTLKVLTGPQLQALLLPEPEALVPNLIFRGFSTLLAGDSKLGKSSLLLRMILAMATGGWWLDRERRPENRLPVARVLWLNFEDPLWVTRERAEQMMAPESLPEGFLTMEPPYGYSLPALLEWLPEAKERLALDAVVMDPISVAAEWKDETDNSELTLTFKALQRLAAETQLGLLSNHHVTKKAGEYGLNIRGAGAIKANTLGYLVLDRIRQEELFRLHGVNKLTGHWDVTLGRKEQGWQWWIESTAAGHTRTSQQAMKEGFKADLLRLIRDQPLVTTDRLADLLDLKRRTCLNYLEELRGEKRVLSHPLPPCPQGGRPGSGWIAVPVAEE